MLTPSRTSHSLSTTLSKWWRNAIEPVALRVTEFSTENNLALSTTAVGLTTAGFFLSPLYLLAVPSVVLATLPAYAKVIHDWQAKQQIGDAAIEASLVTALMASNHLTLSAASVMMLAAGRSSDRATEGSSLMSIALGTLAVPVAGLSGAAATLYATIARNRPRHATQQYLRQHDIKVHDWLAACKLPKVEAILLDQSCLVTVTLKNVYPFHHRLAEDVVWYALSVAPSGLRRQLQVKYPNLPSGARGADVQLLTLHQLRLSNLTVQGEADDYLYVVVNRQVIGALEVEKTPIPEARQLLAALRQIDQPITLLCDSNMAETEALLVEFDLAEGHANMGWQQKVDFCQEQMAACFISREVPSAVGLADVAVTLSTEGGCSDITLDETSFGMLFVSMDNYAKQRVLRQVCTTAPMIVTIGGVFFLQWGMPAAIAVQGVAVLLNRLVDWQLKPKKAHLVPAPVPLAATTALTA